MIGKDTIELDYRDFVRGASSSDHVSDGGFSPRSSRLNLTVVPGVLYFQADRVDESTNLTGDIIASCEDPASIAGNEQIVLDENAAFYIYDSGSLTKKVTASTNGVTHGHTTLVSFNGKFYASTAIGDQDIIEYDGATTLVEDWWSSASHLNQAALSSATAWRPLLVYENNLYVGDANKVHRIDSSETVTNGILTLESGELITAMGVDKGSGYMLIATTKKQDASLRNNMSSKIYVYDGFSNKARKVINTSGVITSFVEVDRTYVFYGNKLGYFTGGGIRFLRKLNFSLNNANNSVYPHHTAVIDNTLFYTDVNQIFSYGEVIAGRKVFNIVEDTGDLGDANDDILTIFKSAGEVINMGTIASKLFSLDLASTSSNDGDLYSNKFHFDRPVYIRTAYIETEDAVTNNNAFGVLTIIDETQTQTNFTPTINDTGANRFTWTPRQLSLKVRTAQIHLPWATSGIGYKRIVISYDVAE